MFGTNVKFSELADPVDVLPVEPNSRGGRTSSWKFRMNIPVGLSLECVI